MNVQETPYRVSSVTLIFDHHRVGTDMLLPAVPQLAGVGHQLRIVLALRCLQCLFRRVFLVLDAF